MPARTQGRAGCVQCESLSRRSPRYRIDIAATAVPLLGGDMAVCRTLDVSDVGLSLDTAAWFPLGTRLSLSLVDPGTGAALEVIGDVVREATAPSWTLGILLIEPPLEWQAVVKSAQRKSGSGGQRPVKRLRVLVFGDDHRQRGAMALYVTSGWDVLFATEEESIAEALAHIELDAVVAELDLADPRLLPIMHNVRQRQPTARRIVRGAGRGETDLVHRFVDRDAGLEALLDAVTADIPMR
ncbi:MAG TPA: PilZ domain-containing protein [Kofleriaceae bacterium]|nr:PilZ domain-containing protein [Kofleriaceae bacterium]